MGVACSHTCVYVRQTGAVDVKIIYWYGPRWRDGFILMQTHSGVIRVVSCYNTADSFACLTNFLVLLSNVFVSAIKWF